MTRVRFADAAPLVAKDISKQSTRVDKALEVYKSATASTVEAAYKALSAERNKLKYLQSIAEEMNSLE